MLKHQNIIKSLSTADDKITPCTNVTITLEVLRYVIKANYIACNVIKKTLSASPQSLIDRACVRAGATVSYTTFNFDVVQYVRALCFLFRTTNV